jgi:hypothetical protein
MKTFILLIFLFIYAKSWGFTNIQYINEKLVIGNKRSMEKPTEFVNVNIDGSTTFYSSKETENKIKTLNVYSIGTYICVANANPNLEAAKMAQCSINSTKSDGKLDLEVISTFETAYKEAFLKASVLLPNTCSNITYPNNPIYETLRHSSNFLQGPIQFPRAIYTIDKETDIVNAMVGINLIDTNTYLKIRVMSGGHDYRGFASTGKETFVFNTQLLNKINVDTENNLAQIYSGNTNVNLYTVLNQQNLVIPVGN